MLSPGHRKKDMMLPAESVLARPPKSTFIRRYTDYHKRHYVLRLVNGREVDTAFPLDPPPGHDEASYEQACREEAIHVAEELLEDSATPPINADQFTRLCERLAVIDLFGDGPPVPPWGDAATVAAVKQAINAGAPSLPLAYQTGYVMPLLQNLDSVLRQAGDSIEPLAGAVYEHAPGGAVQPELQRFLAVISNLYRSFLSRTKRAAANIPFAMPQDPPLAVFLHSGQDGPFTIPSDDTQQLFGGDVGVVSLPSTYRDHPVLWASLAHETGGHDVTHADAGLLPELAAGVQTLFGGGPVHAGRRPTSGQLQGLLWSYWMDEASADVYGLLNIGPSFAHNLAAFFAALNNRAVGLPIPSLRTRSGHPANDPALDVHPTDILRLHLAIGVIEQLSGLAQTTRDAYVSAVQALAQRCAQGASTVEIQGHIAIQRDRWLPINDSLPLSGMQDAARSVGAYIATARLQALGGHSIQEIETWDDADELTARQIADTFARGDSVVDMGDDAQLLAGATLALVTQPDLYDQATRLLTAALDRSYATDPIWGASIRDPMYVRYQFLPPGSPKLRYALRVR